MKKIFSYFLLLTPVISNAQVSCTPAFPSIHDTVTLIYDATQGNGELIGFDPIYVHTGIITTSSQSAADWKYVKSDWGDNREELKLEYLGDNKHQLKFHIQSFYGFPDAEEVTDLAFVFRDESSQYVGRTSEESDIIYPIQPNIVSSTNTFLSYSMQENKLVIDGSKYDYTIQAFGDDIVRIGFNDADTTFESKCVVMNPGNVGTVSEENGLLTYSISNVTVAIEKDPLQFSFIYQNDTSIKEINGMETSGNTVIADFQILAEQAFHGTGSRAIDLDLSGQALNFYNQAQWGYDAGKKDLNIAIPFLVSSKMYGILFDHYYPSSIKILEDDNKITYTAENDDLAYYFVGANSMPELMDNYTDLTGKAAMLPRWSLGYIQSRFGYETESEARSMVDQLQGDDFPLDALVLDLYWFGDPTTMGDLDWDYSRFPNPTGMIKDFEEKGVKTILITEPYVTTKSSNFNEVVNNQYVGTDDKGEAMILNDFWAHPAVLLNINDNKVQDWVWNFYKAQIDNGVTGWWFDLGEPEIHPDNMWHNDTPARELHQNYSLEWAKMLHEKHMQQYPGQRLFNLTRSGNAGMQRYGTAPWSGDINRTFTGMAVQISNMLNMGYSGVGFMHSDLGGFAGNIRSDELYTRWIQLGTFSPIMRAHGYTGGGIPAEPVLFPEPYKSICRDFIKLRYQLLPYNYTLAFENATTGAPLARAMDYYYPNATNFHNTSDQYFWGKDLLIAPIVEQGETSRTVILPEGNWYNYFTNEKYEGNTTVNVNADINTMLVFVRAGSIIPHAYQLNSTDHYNADNLSIHCFLDNEYASAQYELYHDDGTSPDVLINGQYVIISFSANKDDQKTTLSASVQGAFHGSPEERKLEFRIKNQPSFIRSVKANSSEITIFDDYASYENTWPAAFYDKVSDEVFIHLIWKNDELNIEVIPSEITSISTSEAIQEITVYPNPTNDKVFWKSKHNIIQINVYNNQGVLIETIKQTATNQLDLSHLSTGMYFLELKTQQTPELIRVVKL